MTAPGRLPELSLHLPFLAHRPEQFVPYMALVQDSAAVRLWSGQPLLLDACQGFAYAAGMGFRAPVGLAVALAPTRHPFEAALQARGLALTTGHPVAMGFGPGDPVFQTGLHGAPWRKPLTAMREFLTQTRGLLDGGLVDQSGEYFTLRGRQGTIPHPRVDLGLGVLRPAMARLAGEVADLALTWLTPPAYIAEVLEPELTAAAEAAGRRRPRVVASVHAAMDTGDRDPVDLVLRTSAGHLAAPHYQDMLRQAGIEIAAIEPAAAAQALVDAGVFLFGDSGRILTQLADYAQAGVDEVALHLHGAATSQSTKETVAELRLLLDARETAA